MSTEFESLQKVASGAANTSGVISVTSGSATAIMGFFGENATAIGAICTVVTCVSMLVFKVIEARLKKKAYETYYKSKIEEDLGL
jgi:hypothetical protein